MPGPVFLCYDGSEDSRAAIRVAGGLLGGPAVVATAWQALRHASLWAPGLAAELASGIDDLDRIYERRALETAEEGCRVAGEAGFQAEPLACEAEGAVWAALMHRAADRDAAAIVVGRRGRSRVAAAVLGSVSLGLVNHADRPVLVVPAAGG